MRSEPFYDNKKPKFNLKKGPIKNHCFSEKNFVTSAFGIFPSVNINRKFPEFLLYVAKIFKDTSV